MATEVDVTCPHRRCGGLLLKKKSRHAGGERFAAVDKMTWQTHRDICTSEKDRAFRRGVGWGSYPLLGMLAILSVCPQQIISFSSFPPPC